MYGVGFKFNYNYVSKKTLVVYSAIREDGKYENCVVYKLE
jgi:hypothetical protein